MTGPTRSERTLTYTCDNAMVTRLLDAISEDHGIDPAKVICINVLEGRAVVTEALTP